MAKKMSKARTGKLVRRIRNEQILMLGRWYSAASVALAFGTVTGAGLVAIAAGALTNKQAVMCLVFGLVCGGLGLFCFFKSFSVLDDLVEE